MVEPSPLEAQTDTCNHKICVRIFTSNFWAAGTVLHNAHGEVRYLTLIGTLLGLQILHSGKVPAFNHAQYWLKVGSNARLSSYATASSLMVHGVHLCAVPGLQILHREKYT